MVEGHFQFSFQLFFLKTHKKYRHSCAFLTAAVVLVDQKRFSDKKISRNLMLWTLSILSAFIKIVREHTLHFLNSMTTSFVFFFGVRCQVVCWALWQKFPYPISVGRLSPSLDYLIFKLVVWIGIRCKAGVSKLSYGLKKQLCGEPPTVLSVRVEERLAICEKVLCPGTGVSMEAKTVSSSAYLAWLHGVLDSFDVTQ